MKRILLLHGALGSTQDLVKLSQELELKGMHCFMIDFIGHGFSKFEEPLSIENLLGQTRKFIENNQLQGCVVFGYSLGGYIALKLAEKIPEIFSGIVTLATKLTWTQEIALKEASKCDEDTIKSKAPFYFKNLSEQHLDPSGLLTATKALLLGMPEQTEIPGSKITCPILLLLGESDKLVTFEETSAFNETLSGGTIKMLTNTKHALESADTLELAHLIEKFAQN